MIKLLNKEEDFPLARYISSSDKRSAIINTLRSSISYQRTKNSDTFYCHKWFGTIKINSRTIIFKNQYKIFIYKINKLYYDVANSIMLINDDLAIKML